MDNIKIYVMTHKKFDEPKDATYIPFQVGKAINPDLGYEGDDTKDSISSLNPYYGELTGIYWIWKNDKTSAYVGICHYRRFFVNESYELLQENDFAEILRTYDVMVSRPIYGEKSYFETYKEAHHIKDLQKIREVLLDLHPEYIEVFDEIVEGKKNYFGNLFVAPKAIFDAYASWLFSIFFEAQKTMDVESYDAYHKRVFGFLSEEMLLVWLTYQKLNVYEAYIGITAEKAETVELKLALTQLVKIKEFSQARELFYALSKIRPDVRLEMSDILGELPIMEQILYVLEKEESQKWSGLYSTLEYLPDMVKHYKKLMDIFAKSDTTSIAFTEGEVSYFKEMRVTSALSGMMLLNNPDSAFDKTNLKQKWIQFYEAEHETAFAEEMKGLPF